MMAKILKKIRTLNFRLFSFIFITYLLLVGLVLIACYYRFYYNMLESYERHGTEILNLAAEDIVIDSIPDYISGHFDRAEYERSLKKLNHYPQYFHEVFYLYAYHLKDDGLNATYLFDAKVDHDEQYELGENYELEEDIRAQIAEHGAGGQLDMVTDETQWGYLMTCSKPLLDSKGVFQGYILVDFDLTKLRDDNIKFILGLFMIIIEITLVIFFIGMKLVSKKITMPIEKMYLCLSGFKYSSNADREDNIRRLKELNIHTNEEIQSLYDALVSTTEESFRYMNDYRTATEKLGIANEKAYTDILTGAGNKRAYDDRSRELQGRLDKGETLEIAILVADINNLKYVNDKFGHERGDEYIKGCFWIMTNLFKSSHFYRIGGDEFVVILEGTDYMGRQALFDKVQAKYHDSFTDDKKEPWERYSVSIGLADCGSADTDLSIVFSRADSEMYKAKTIFREKYGSYR